MKDYLHLDFCIRIGFDAMMESQVPITGKIIQKIRDNRIFNCMISYTKVRNVSSTENKLNAN